MRGNGSTIVGRRDLDVGAGEVTLIELPGIGTVGTECQAGPQSVFRTFNTSGETVDISELHKGVPSVFTIPNGGASANSTLTGDVWQLQIATRGAAPTVATVEVTQGFAGPKACAIFAQGDGRAVSAAMETGIPACCASFQRAVTPRVHGVFTRWV